MKVTQKNYWKDVEPLLPLMPPQLMSVHQRILDMLNAGIDIEKAPESMYHKMENYFQTLDKLAEKREKEQKAKKAEPKKPEIEKPKPTKKTESTKPKKTKTPKKKATAKPKTKTVSKKKSPEKTKPVSKAKPKVKVKIVKEKVAKAPVQVTRYSMELQLIQKLLLIDGKPRTVKYLKNLRSQADKAIQYGALHYATALEDMKGIIYKIVQEGEDKNADTMIVTLKEDTRERLKSYIDKAKVRMRVEFLAGIEKKK